MNELAPASQTNERTAVMQQQAPSYDLSPRNFEEAWRLAEILADSELVPKDFRGKPGNCLVGMQWGAELGLKALQSLQGIAVINGRPSIWGDTMLAIVRASPLCEYVIEGTYADGTAWCKVKRRGEPEQERTFSDADAKTAGLLGKQGPWMTAPKRMKQMRARAFALRDVFTDILRGMHMAEESVDIPPAPEKHMGIADEVRPAAPALPAYSAEDFEKNLPAWAKLVEGGKKTASELLAMLSTKATFDEQQKARILSLKKARAAEPPAQASADTPIQDGVDSWAADYAAAEGSAQ
jgi:hypothetical protein